MRNIVILVIGLIAGAVVGWMFRFDSTADTSNPSSEESKPLYWVAPMDASYRRDKPGKSPMGMDLVPVFDEQEQQEAGTVFISPDVVNNLGVRTAPAETKPLATSITTVGYVGYNEDKLVHVHPRVEGWVEALYVKASGEPVEKGEPLYSLYSPELVNAQEEYLLAIKRNNGNLIQAAENRLMALQMPPKALQTLKASGKVMQTITYFVPQSGVVDNLNIREGFYVQPGTTIMSIGALDDVWVEAEVFERQAPSVMVDQPVTMTLGFVPGKVWQGKVDYIYPTLNSDTRTVSVRLRFDNPDRLLKPNMFAQITLHTSDDKARLQVPKEAVIRTGQQSRVVLAKGEGKFKSVAVTLGQVTPDWVEILAGLEEGDRVVTSAQFLLDSESSIDSDFMRMNHDQIRTEEQAEPESVQRAEVMGKINRIDAAGGTINISRGPIEKWGRGPATMDFVIGSSLDMSGFRQNDHVRFVFEIRAGEFVVTEMSTHQMSGDGDMQ